MLGFWSYKHGNILNMLCACHMALLEIFILYNMANLQKILFSHKAELENCVSQIMAHFTEIL